MIILPRGLRFVDRFANDSGVVRKLRKDAFTLIEVLVATAILALILVLISQVVDGIMKSIQVQNRQLDSVSAARKALDVFETDMRTAVISPDASILVSGSSQPPLVFLSERRGPQGAANHRLLAISYSLSGNGFLNRSYRSVPFTDGNLLSSAAVAAPPTQQSTLSKGIIAWQIRVVAGDEKTPLNNLSNGGGAWATINYNGLSVPSGYQALIVAGPPFATLYSERVTALETWLLAVDENSFELLETSGKLEAARAALGDNPEVWRQNLDAADLPHQVISSARVMNKTIPLQ